MKNVLISNCRLGYGGSERFLFTLAPKLKELGFNPIFYSPRLGIIANKLVEHGFAVYNTIDELPNDIALIHGQHCREIYRVFCRYYNQPIISVIHGVLPWQESPPFLPTIQQYVTVSEEIYYKLIVGYGIEKKKVKMIRNPVDLEIFKFKENISSKPKRVLLLSHKADKNTYETVKDAAEAKGYAFEWVGGQNAKWNVEEYLQESDIVVTLGRGVLESLACGCFPIVFDRFGGDGAVTQESFYSFRRKNFSGRYLNKQFTSSELIKEFEKYNTEDIIKLHKTVVEEHDVEVIAKGFCDLYLRTLDANPMELDNKLFIKSIVTLSEIADSELMETISYMKLDTMYKEKTKMCSKSTTNACSLDLAVE